MCILVPACSVSCGQVYSLLPGVSVSLPCFVLPCLALMSTLMTVYLILPPRLRVPRFSLLCAPDRRPDLNSKRRPFTSFCFPFFKSLLFCSCVSGKEVATRPSALARVKSAWEFGGIAASPLAASPHAR